ncbi:two-component response regulator ARR14-like [Gossypium hirsutum]|uniref:Two-component response regulator ARR14-like n=1 Tax=Gossypium hirsutum TaxID=3635 RepID=A0A1U8KTZ0_GOSHI|nr:two-component response regulator ARR14-like [Gossypium hirsutum]
MEEKRRSNCGEGFSVLVVDHDTTSLMLLASMLQLFSYQVTTTEVESVALSLIEEAKDRFKLVMADVNMDDVNSLSFLRKLLKMNIPFILMSNEKGHKAAEKAVAYGASLHLEKPISKHDLKYLWQYAYGRPAKRAKHLHDNELRTYDPNKNVGERDEQKKMLNIMPPTERKPRLLWNEELHQKFIAAITALGYANARPKSILTMMDEPNLTQRQVASHLQKHKEHMKRLMSKASPSELASNANASTSIYGKPGFLYMPQGYYSVLSQLGGHTHKYLNDSVAGTSQFSYLAQHSTAGRFSSEYHNEETLQFPNILESMHEKQNIIPDPSPSGNLVYENHNWEPWTEAARGVAEAEIGVRNAAGGVTWNQQSPELAQLLKHLEEEGDACGDCANQPNPDAVDQFCEWLKEAIQGNDNNP